MRNMNRNMGSELRSARQPGTGSLAESREMMADRKLSMV